MCTTLVVLYKWLLCDPGPYRPSCYFNIGTSAFKLHRGTLFGICTLFRYSDSCWVVGINCSKLFFLFLLNLKVNLSRVTLRVLLRLKGLTDTPPSLPTFTSDWRPDLTRYFVATCVPLRGATLPVRFMSSWLTRIEARPSRGLPQRWPRYRKPLYAVHTPSTRYSPLRSPPFYLWISVSPVIFTHFSIGHWSSRCASEIRLSSHSYQPPQPPWINNVPPSSWLAGNDE